MEISTAITTAIHDLLDHDVSYLSDPLGGLGERLADAVDSFLGLELVLHAHGQPFVLRSWTPAAQTGQFSTSLHLPAAALLTPAHQGGLTFWAGTAGGFVDLAADLTHALALAADTIRLDEHLSGVSMEDGLFGLTEAAVVNQAVGTLIAAGHAPEAARAELERQAVARGLSLAARASELLAGR